jgi:hypothetical protein
MRFPPGVDAEKAIGGYHLALSGFTAEAIAAGIAKFLRGECQDVNPKYCPHPPELAHIIRTAVVPTRTHQPTLPKPEHSWLPGERERMRLKMPMWRHAFECGLMDQLDAANRAGFGETAVLAQKWGIPIPEELLLDEAKTEHEWRIAGNRARAAIAGSPPPFLRRYHEITGREFL